MAAGSAHLNNAVLSLDARQVQLDADALAYFIGMLDAARAAFRTKDYALARSKLNAALAIIARVESRRAT